MRQSLIAATFSPCFSTMPMNFNGIGGGGGGPTIGGGPATTGGGGGRLGRRAAAAVPASVETGTGCAPPARSPAAPPRAPRASRPGRPGPTVAVLRGVVRVWLDAGAAGVADADGHIQVAMSASTARPSAASSHGRGRFDATGLLSCHSPRPGNKSTPSPSPPARPTSPHPARAPPSRESGIRAPSRAGG